MSARIHDKCMCIAQVHVQLTILTTCNVNDVHPSGPSNQDLNQNINDQNILDSGYCPPNQSSHSEVKSCPHQTQSFPCKPWLASGMRFLAGVVGRSAKSLNFVCIPACPAARSIAGQLHPAQMSQEHIKRTNILLLGGAEVLLPGICETC